MMRGRPPTLRAGLAGAMLVAAVACGGPSPPPQPGQMRGVPPDLRGRRVILLPVQQNAGVAGDVDAELAFTLKDLGRDVEWILEEEISEVLARSPGVDTQTRRLPVGQFLHAEVNRIGDPLYGHLRRMAALMDADAILIPVAASFEANTSVDGSSPRVRLTMTLIEPRTGRVVWFGIEEGGDFPRGDPRGLASAVEAMARTLLWYVGE